MNAYWENEALFYSGVTTRRSASHHSKNIGGANVRSSKSKTDVERELFCKMLHQTLVSTSIQTFVNSTQHKMMSVHCILPVSYWSNFHILLIIIAQPSLYTDHSKFTFNLFLLLFFHFEFLLPLCFRCLSCCGCLCFSLGCCLNQFYKYNEKPVSLNNPSALTSRRIFLCAHKIISEAQFNIVLDTP